MASKRNSPVDEPVQVFRQFAWHLAGTLAAAAAKQGGRAGAPTKPRPPKAAGAR